MVEFWSVPDYALYTFRHYFFFGIFGWLGALSVQAATNAIIKAPTRANGGWQLNAVGLWISGIMTGILAGNSILHAAIAGGIAPLIIGYVIYRAEKWIKALILDG